MDSARRCRTIRIVVPASFVLALIILGCATWVWLQVFAPDWTISHSPSTEMVIQALLGHRSSPGVWDERMRQCRTEDIASFRAMLKHSEDRRRRFAASALGDMRDQLALPDLCLILARDPSFQARYTAARALADIGNPAAIPHLMKAMGDPDTCVRNIAVEALGDMGATEAESSIVAFAVRHTYPSAQSYAETALAKIRSRSAKSGQPSQ